MIGIVVARDPDKHRARVQFPDHDNMVSAWLPVGVQTSAGDYDYWLPDLQTQVACLMDENYEFGVVLCAIYSDADLPPVTGKDLYYRRFKDGTIIQYDRASHKLTANVQGTVDLVATGDITSTSPLWTHNGNLKVNGHVVASGNVADANGAKTMAGMRDVFNTHTHRDNSHGATTNPPDQGM